MAQLDVINFGQVTSCGTNTEVSLPCMFSVYGRRHYDEDKIRGTESLLNVLAHAGMKVVWRDNQSGCKGACIGVEEEKLGDSNVSELCDGDRCLDEILLHGLDSLLADNQGNLVL
ncbi:MAG: sulfatase-like hydrolase/transferase, partial [Propionivibrio sp.]